MYFFFTQSLYLFLVEWRGHLLPPGNDGVSRQSRLNCLRIRRQQLSTLLEL